MLENMSLFGVNKEEFMTIARELDKVVRESEKIHEQARLQKTNEIIINLNIVEKFETNNKVLKKVKNDKK